MAAPSIEQKMRFILALRESGVQEERVLKAMEAIPREMFVDAHFQTRAYENYPLPIARGQTISQPSVVGLMTQALEATSRSKVLEIGTGSGYQAAILSKLCRRVYTVERHAPLAALAAGRFAELGLTNITHLHADGTLGWPEQAPFDRIIVTAAAEDVPKVLLTQLAHNGIMVLPIGQSDDTQQLIKVNRTDSGYHYAELQAVRFVPLLGGVETK